MNAIHLWSKNGLLEYSYLVQVEDTKSTCPPYWEKAQTQANPLLNWECCTSSKKSKLTSTISTSWKSKSKFTVYYFWKERDQISNITSTTTIQHMKTDSTDVCRCLWWDVDKGAKSSLHSPETERWKCQTPCAVMHSFILKTEGIKYIYIKERKSV